jgi:hypothetical protein
MKNGIKALIGAALISCIMIGCESTQTRGACADAGDCNPAQCESKGDCDPSNCDQSACADKAEACASEKKAADCCGTCGGAAKAADCCGTCGGDKGHGHDHKKACGSDCTKPCCA